MSLSPESALDSIDKHTYDNDKCQQLRLDELTAGRDYVARLVASNPTDEMYATDFWVTLDDIRHPKKRRFLSWFQKSHIMIALLPVAENGDTLDCEPSEYHAKESGLLYTPGYTGWFGMGTPEMELGYLLENDDSGVPEGEAAAVKVSIPAHV